MSELPDEKTITLRRPVQLGDISYTELNLREPTAREMMQWDKLSDTEADIMAVSIVSGVPKGVIEQIGVRDLNAAARYLAAFLR